MLDIQKTITLIKNGLLEPRATWQSYLEENKSWKETALLLTVPVILVSMILSGLLSLVFGGRMGIGGWLISLIIAAAGISITAFLFSFLAGVAKGTHNFDKGLAAVSLSGIPAYAGNIFAPIPFIGWLITLVTGIISLVFLYRIIPLYLEVPDDNRVLHYIASLVATFITMLILVSIFASGMMSGA